MKVEETTSLGMHRWHSRVWGPCRSGGPGQDCHVDVKILLQNYMALMLRVFVQPPCDADADAWLPTSYLPA